MSKQEMHEFAPRAAELLKRRLHRLRAKAAGRGRTIERLLAERQAARERVRQMEKVFSQVFP